LRLTETLSCDYSGADAVARAHHRAVANGTELRLVVTADVVRRVLCLNGLDRLVAVYPDLDGAIAAGAECPAAKAQPGIAVVADHVACAELQDSVVHNIYIVSMMLQAAADLPRGAAAQRITEALGRLDDVVREVRDHLLADCGQGVRPGFARQPQPDVLERSARARDRSALLRQRVAQTAHAVHFAASDTATLLERQVDLLGQPARIDYPTEIKRWRVFADQARQMAESWEQRPQICQNRTEPKIARIGVFLVDDHEVARHGVRILLEAEPDITVVGEAGTASSALARIPAAQPDVAVLDVRLPDGDGVGVCREIRSKMPGLACLMLTGFSDDEALFDAIMAGAAGYVLKQIRGSDLIAAVRAVACGQPLLDAQAVSRVMQRMRDQAQWPDPLAGLDYREKQILALIGEGLTNRQIGERLSLAEKTVKNYASELFAKLGMKRRTQAAAFAARVIPADREEPPRRGS
jgi:DNA-binding NarL/FixJ family response regulator